MKSTLNTNRLNNLLRGIQKSIDLFESQGHTDVYFTAQFFRGGKKQNSIERGDLPNFAKGIRTYVTSEEADSARIEFFDDSSGKSIYSKAISELRSGDPAAKEVQVADTTGEGLNGYSGLGEAQVRQVNDLIARRVDEERRNDEFQRLNREVDELRTKYAALEIERDELEASVAAKKGIEFYSTLVGAAFPGLAPLLTGTPLAQAAGFLAGTSDIKGNALPAKEAASEDGSSIAAMVNEFCHTLNSQEASAVHLLFTAFETDRSKIQSALHYITTTSPTQTA